MARPGLLTIDFVFIMVPSASEESHFGVARAIVQSGGLTGNENFQPHSAYVLFRKLYITQTPITNTVTCGIHVDWHLIAIGLGVDTG